MVPLLIGAGPRGVLQQREVKAGRLSCVLPGPRGTLHAREGSGVCVCVCRPFDSEGCK